MVEGTLPSSMSGLNAAKWSRVENGQVVEPEGIIEPSDVVVVGTSKRE